MRLEETINTVGNAAISTGASAGVLGVLSANYNVIMLGLTATGVFGGLLLRYLGHKLEKRKVDLEEKRLDNERRDNNK